MIISLSLLRKKTVIVCEGLVGYLLIYSKEKVTISIRKQQQHSYCFPKKTTKMFSVHLLAFCRVCCWINDFFFFDCHLHCHVVIVMCFYASAPDGCCHKSPIPTHFLRIHKGTKAVGSGPHAWKCYCPNVFLSLCVYHNMTSIIIKELLLPQVWTKEDCDNRNKNRL